MSSENLRRKMITSGLAGLAIAFLPGSHARASATRNTESNTGSCFDCEQGCEQSCQPGCSYSKVSEPIELELAR